MIWYHEHLPHIFSFSVWYSMTNMNWITWDEIQRKENWAKQGKNAYGFAHLLGMLVFRALQVLKWFNFPVVSIVDETIVDVLNCNMYPNLRWLQSSFGDKHSVYMTYKHYHILFLLTSHLYVMYIYLSYVDILLLQHRSTKYLWISENWHRKQKYIENGPSIYK